MSETLASRVGRLVSGGFHSLLDKAEDLAPDVALNESVREIERAIDDVRAELGQVLAQKHLATKKLTQESNQHETLSEQIHIALNQGRDDLASVGIAEQIDIEARLPVLETTIANCVDKENELTGYINALQAKRREMLTAISDLQKAKAKTVATDTSTNPTGVTSRVDKSSNAFDRIMARQTGLHLNGQDPKTLADLAELENLSRNNRIAERLAKLKANKS